MNNINVHFLNKTVSFTEDTASGSRFDAVLTADSPVTRAKVLKILESCNRVAVLSSSPQETFRQFARDFKAVEAAGGVVANPQGEILMMFRRKHWDLPKGHLEPCETVRHCARREVAEETGIAKTNIGEQVCSTYHAYNVYGEWELKHTQWFAMTCDGTENPVPQHEEGIEQVRWIPHTMLGEILAESYPTIREVMDNYSEAKQ